LKKAEIEKDVVRILKEMMREALSNSPEGFIWKRREIRDFHEIR